MKINFAKFLIWDIHSWYTETNTPTHKMGTMEFSLNGTEIQ